MILQFRFLSVTMILSYNELSVLLHLFIEYFARQSVHILLKENNC